MRGESTYAFAYVFNQKVLGFSDGETKAPDGSVFPLWSVTIDQALKTPFRYDQLTADCEWVGHAIAAEIAARLAEEKKQRAVEREAKRAERELRKQQKQEGAPPK